MEEQKRVLIVEDEKAMASVLSLKLENAGFSTDVAHDGLVAEEKMRSETYDFILLDLMLPGKDGFTILKETQDLEGRPPIAVITSLRQQEDIERVKQFGVEDHFAKSQVSLQEIADYVKQKLA